MKDPILGYTHFLDERIDNTLYSLNESMIENLKKNAQLKAIKTVEFSLEEVDEKPVLMVKVTFRSGNTYSTEFTSWVDESAIELNKNEIEAYFEKSKGEAVAKYLEGGVLEADFLKAHEPQVYEQLCKIYLLGMSPDTNNGAEFTSQDKEFFLKIIQNHQ